MRLMAAVNTLAHLLPNNHVATTVKVVLWLDHLPIRSRRYWPLGPSSSPRALSSCFRILSDTTNVYRARAPPVATETRQRVTVTLNS